MTVDLTRDAYRWLDEALEAAEPRLPDPNKHGEVAGCGPVWACERFGAADHDYKDTCPACKLNYHYWLIGVYTAAGVS